MSQNANRFRKRLRKALQPDGWRPSGDDPVVVVPCADTYVRTLENGWVAVLVARWHDRDEIELPSWLAGMHGVVTVEASATFPAAERLGARLGLTDPSFGFDVAPPFLVPGREPGYRQFRGPEDHERVVAEIVRYAEHVLVPAAERDAGLDAWMAAYDEADEDQSALCTPKVPVMLIAHGHAERATERLRVARPAPDGSSDQAFDAFTTRFEEFVRSGEALPTDGDALRGVAEERAAVVVAAQAEAELESADPEEDVSGWQVLGGLALVVAVVIYLVGKGAAVAGIDIGWSWLPAAAVAAFGVIKIAEHTEELREKWGKREGAKRVQEYLDQQRRQRERGAEAADERYPQPTEAADAQDSPPADAAEGSGAPPGGADDYHPDPGRE